MSPEIYFGILKLKRKGFKFFYSFNSRMVLALNSRIPFQGALSMKEIYFFSVDNTVFRRDC